MTEADTAKRLRLDRDRHGLRGPARPRSRMRWRGCRGSAASRSAIMSERLRLTLDRGADRARQDRDDRASAWLRDRAARRPVRRRTSCCLVRHDAGMTMTMRHMMATIMPGTTTARKVASAQRDDSGHGSPGHVHDDPADRGKRWYQTGQGQAGHLHRPVCWVPPGSVEVSGARESANGPSSPPA